MSKMGIKVSITRKGPLGARKKKREEKKIKSKDSRKTTIAELKNHHNSQKRKPPKFSMEIEIAQKETFKERREVPRPKK